MRGWSIETLLSLQIPEGIAMSPDATVAVYSLRTLDEEEGKYRYKLWSVTRDGAPIQLTRGDSKDTYPQFSPDGKWLAFISDRKRSASDDNDHAPEQQLYVLPVAGGEAFLAAESLGNVYDYVFSADGSCIYVIVDVEETAYEKYLRTSAEEDMRDVTHEERNQLPRRICRVSLDDFSVTTMYQRDYGLMQLAAGSTDETLVFVTNYTGLTNDLDDCDIWCLSAVEDGDYQAQALVSRKGACVQPAIAPTGDVVAFVAPRGDWAEHAQSDLWLVDRRSGQVYNLTQSLDFVGDVQDVQWLMDGSLVATVERGLYASLVQFIPEKEVGGRWRYRFVSGKTSVVGEFSVAAKTAAVGYLAETADRPHEVFVLNLQESGTHDGVQWTKLHAPYQDLPRARVQPFTWISFDGREMEGVLSLPNPDVAGPGPYPMLVDIHGGPAWHATMAFSNYLNVHWLGSLGYAVFCPNYRGGIGYGQAYIQANAMDLGGGDYQDIMTGVDAVLRTGWVDEARLGLTGGSYGGYMTNWIIGHDHRFQAAVSEFGIWNLLTDFGCSTQRVWEVMYLGRYWENEALYLERSPARYVQNINTPVLIIHGDDDDNTFPANSKEMYNALLEAGKTVEYVHYPREGHGIREPRHRADELSRIAAWFGHYLQTPQTPVPILFGQAGAIQGDQYKALITGVEVTNAYKAFGDDYEAVLAVSVTLMPASQSRDGALELKLDNPATADVALYFTGREPHQRPSVFPSAKQLPLGVAVGGVVVTGDVVLRLEDIQTVHFLFDDDILGYASVDKLLLDISNVAFRLV
ncbi:S9 family peptidase [Alicyclobacillus suci]|uniref:S9 family peptidase n=1 Tax=Alicyclobacillus suci TaxID=2816080 RepID=UPI001A8D97A0|nr:S9 family peptidase [Alicyclobacillus suci]